MPAENYDIRDDRFAKLIHMNAGMDTLWTGGRWAEGPAYLAAGRYLIWSDIPNDRIMRWDEMNGEVAVFEQHCRNHNGHTVDRQGRLIACEHRGRCVSRYEFDGTKTILADSFDGKRLNSPNDVVVKSDGSVWFTDPSYGIDSEYEGDASPMEQDGRHVYRIDPDGSITRVIDDMKQPNGLAFSVDETVLFVADGVEREVTEGTQLPRSHQLDLRAVDEPAGVARACVQLSIWYDECRPLPLSLLGIGAGRYVVTFRATDRLGQRAYARYEVEVLP